MLSSHSRSWLVVLLVAAGSLALCGRTQAQEPEEEAADRAKPAPTEATPQARDVATPAQDAKMPEQTPKRSPRPGDVQKVFVIKNTRVRLLAGVLTVFPATIKLSRYAGTTALGVSAPPAVMAAVEETIKRLDVPPPPVKNVELTGYILEALAQGSSSVPPDLEGVVGQLSRAFSYRAYRLVDTLVARAREGSGLSAEADTMGGNGKSSSERSRYMLHATQASVTHGDAGTTIRLDQLHFGAKAPDLMSGPVDGSGSRQYRSVDIEADLDIREGQRVVVGKSGAGDSGNATFLVLTAKVVD